MNLRRLIAVWSARIIKTACRIGGKQGLTLAGKVALSIDPSILKKLAGEVRKGIFVVCGTNGKTTVTTLLASVLEADGNKVICNRTGSNMRSGVVAAFVLGAGVGGHLDADYACIEIDEASAVGVFPHFHPGYMILTNLFRDQLDRYGEIDTTMDLLSRAIKMEPEMRLIVNGDEPLCTYLAMRSGNPISTYGIGEQVHKKHDSKEIREGQFCKCCGERLEYTFYHYSQLGDYHCPKCGFKRPALDFDASQIRLSGGISFDVNGFRVQSNFKDFYNIYNLLAVYSAAWLTGVSQDQFNKLLHNYTPPFGRNEEFYIDGTKIMLKLAKNQAGFNQNINAVLDDPAAKDIILLLNDNSQDGADISWIWDVDFDRLKAANAASITVSGIRCLDLRLRLKYAEIDADLEAEIETAIDARIKKGTKNLYVLVNYTGLYPTHKSLKKMEVKSNEHHNRPSVS